MGGKVLEHKGKTIYNAGREEGRAQGRNEGLDEARLESIKNVMESFKISAQQAMAALKIPLTDQPKYATKL